MYIYIYNATLIDKPPRLYRGLLRDPRARRGRLEGHPAAQGPHACYVAMQSECLNECIIRMSLYISLSLSLYISIYVYVYIYIYIYI